MKQRKKGSVVQQEFQCPKHNEKIELVDLSLNPLGQQRIFCKMCQIGQENLFRCEEVHEFLKVECYQQSKLKWWISQIKDNYNNLKTAMFELLDDCAMKIEGLFVKIAGRIDMKNEQVLGYLHSTTFYINDYEQLLNSVSTQIKPNKLELKNQYYFDEDYQVLKTQNEVVNGFYDAIRKLGEISKVKFSQMKLQKVKILDVEQLKQLRRESEEAKTKEIEVKKIDVPIPEQSSINVAEFNQTGELLAMGTNQNQNGCYAEIWKIEKGKVIKLQDLKGHNSDVINISFAKPENTFLTSGRDRIVFIWSTKDDLNWQVIQTIKGAVLPVFCSQFTKNGSLLAMGNRFLTLYDRTESNKWNFKTCFENHEKDLSSLCFNDKGTILVTGSAEGVIIVFAFLYGAWQYRQTLQGHHSYIRFLAFTDSYDFISATQYSIQFWPYSVPQERYFVVNNIREKSYKCIGFNQNKEFLAIGEIEGDGANIYEFSEKNDSHKIILKIEDSIKSIKFTDEGSQFILVMRDKFQICEMIE